MAKKSFTEDSNEKVTLRRAIFNEEDLLSSSICRVSVLDEVINFISSGGDDLTVCDISSFLNSYRESVSRSRSIHYENLKCMFSDYRAKYGEF